MTITDYRCIVSRLLGILFNHTYSFIIEKFDRNLVESGFFLKKFVNCLKQLTI